jgi:hypothetical protein
MIAGPVPRPPPTGRALRHASSACRIPHRPAVFDPVHRKHSTEWRQARILVHVPPGRDGVSQTQSSTPEPDEQPPKLRQLGRDGDTEPSRPVRCSCRKEVEAHRGWEIRQPRSRAVGRGSRIEQGSLARRWSGMRSLGWSVKAWPRDRADSPLRLARVPSSPRRPQRRRYARPQKIKSK